MTERVALVTGATSGIGRAIALRLARSGWRVIVHGRSESACRALAADVSELGRTTPSYHVADFASLGEVAAMAEAFARRERSLHLLVNNAGTGFLASENRSLDGYDATVQVNYLAPYLLTRKLAALMSNSEGATVMNMGSVGQWPLPALDRFFPVANPAIAYARSKLALAAMTLEIAPELKRQGVSIVCMHPGRMIEGGLSRRLQRQARWPLSFLLHRASGRAPAPGEVADRLVAMVENGSVHRQSGEFVCLDRTRRIHRQMRHSANRKSLLAETDRVLAAYLENTTLLAA